jgi:probable addiction module antidote protein
MTLETYPYDVADYIRDRQEAAAYLDACIEESDGDVGFIAKALGDIARAQGMTDVAHKAGLGRQSLYKALSYEGKPTLETVCKVAEVLGLRLTFKAA